jgi:hypothetical protein
VSVIGLSPAVCGAPKWFGDPVRGTNALHTILAAAHLRQKALMMHIYDGKFGAGTDLQGTWQGTQVRICKESDVE